MPLLLAFLIVPLIEIALFIQVGGIIGLGWTLAIVVITAFVGASLVRRQGAGVLLRLQRSFEELRDPTEPLAEGAMILFSGALLLTPGFFTDAVGFALLLPGVRAAIFTKVRSRVSMQSHMDPRSVQFTQQNSIVEGEYSVAEEKTDAKDQSSGWTRH